MGYKTILPYLPFIAASAGIVSYTLYNLYDTKCELRVGEKLREVQDKFESEKFYKEIGIPEVIKEEIKFLENWRDKKFHLPATIKYVNKKIKSLMKDLIEEKEFETSYA